MTPTNSSKLARTHVTRRRFLATGTGAGAALLLPGCGGGSDQGADAGGTLTFQTWANEVEEEAFTKTIAAYEKQNPGAKVELQVVPFPSMYQKLQASLAAGTAPDLARIQYMELGRYSSQGALLDISEYLPDGYGDAFAPAYWNAIDYEGKPYAVPHEAGGQGIYYNADVFKQAGITDFPQSPDEAWTWDEFTDICDRLKQKADVEYPFAVNWQDDNGYRWMMFLFQHGGQLLNDDLTEPAIDNGTGVETIEFTKEFFGRDLVPPSTSIKSSTQAYTLFINGTIAMMFGGLFRLPIINEEMQSNWGVTYVTQDAQPAQNLGGNGIAATAQTENPELAADFLQFLVNAEQMRDYSNVAYQAPTRTDLLEEGLDFEQRPEEAQKLLAGINEVPAQLAAEQTMPAFGSIQDVLNTQLEAAFKSGQSAPETATNISEGIKEAIE